MEQITVHLGRTKILPVSLGYDVSEETIKSQIRARKDASSDLIAEWSVSFLDDGSDGEIILTLDDSVTAEIEHNKGYMDIMRISDGEPVPAFDEIIEVLFQEPVTE